MPDSLGGSFQPEQDTQRKETRDSDNTILAKDNSGVDQPHKLHFKPDDTLGHEHDHHDHSGDHESLGKLISSLSAQGFRPHDSHSTPATRTGPPRSLSFAHGFPVSPSMASRTPAVSYFSNAPEGGELSAEPSVFADLDADYSFTSNKEDQEFRGALEYRDKDDRKGKRRQKERETSDGDTWNLMRWFHESPKDEKQGFEFGASQSGVVASPNEVDEEGTSTSFFTRRPPRRRGSTNNSSTPTSPSIPGKPTGKPTTTTRRAQSLPRPSGSESPRDDNLNDKSLSLHRATTGTGPSDSPKTPTPANAKWSRLRALIPHLVQQHDGGEPLDPGPSAVTSPTVNITDELITGGLSTLMLRLWLERDQKGQRRIPVLLHRLRIRVSDSLHPTNRQGSVFRIECEYANGAARWVVYRELRDFLSLHAHYAVTNMYSQVVDKMPEFPKTSLPYFKFLTREGKDGKEAAGPSAASAKADGEEEDGKPAGEAKEKEAKEDGDHHVKKVDHYFKKDKDKNEQHDKKKVSKSDFAKMQREALENYLIELIRAVMFHPSSNRLAGFLEISALSIALAQSGGAQYKAGFLRIVSKGDGGGGFGRKSATWREKKEQRWCAIRESYLVVVEEPGELAVWDVFLLDSDFHIERPKRYYRQGIDNFEKLLNPEKDGEHHQHQHHQHQHQRHDPSEINNQDFADNRHLHPPGPPSESGRQSLMLSVKSRVSRIFHMGSKHGHSRNASASDSISVSSGSASSSVSGAATPMLDPSTNVNPVIEQPGGGGSGGDKPQDVNGDGTAAKKNGEVVNGKDKPKKRAESDVSKHTFYIVNSQMRLKLYAKNERQMLQFITALEKTAQSSHYTGSNRFDSFAPIRMNVAAQWLVDGRDYFWNLSRAILLAKETIYIHDWWLSPELQMRRPDKPRYRLDKLLERKAKEGVKVYVILYQEVSNRTTPTDSNYAKQRLTGLHDNIMVQRSPSHFQTGTFYWAHHEKMCVIDQTIAFMGGLDLCFGRWDTPQHVLTDDTADTDKSQIWPGKDYSNPRVADFSNLNKPEEDMYDRTKVSRMPWHDVAMQIVGQPARDLARHFVQRWNYLLRIKNHSKVMPFLLPPPEFKPGELARLGLTGTCELQICRSAGPWSLGTPGRIEHSIQNAYLKAIQMSEHFVYIENQFFITSTTVSDVKVENNIGDAIVHRIIRAHRDGTPWKCCIVIPLLPGFTFPVDHSDASAIRIILECQNRTIARGPNSIFSRLRKEGIDPDDYIAIFSLRNWAKMRGDVLTTEQVYIHAKVCIVDDRLAIIGSANINERSQRGDRDSELAAVIRDTDMVDSSMAGKPFKVGRFAHSLRVRLMREHLGIDVDALDEEDLMSHEPLKPEYQQEGWDPDHEQVYGDFGDKPGVTELKKSEQKSRAGNLATDAKDTISQAAFAGAETTTTGAANVLHKLHLADNNAAATGDEKFLEEERTDFNESGQKEPGFASHAIPTLEEKTLKEQRPRKDSTAEDDLDSDSLSSAHTERASEAKESQTDDGISPDQRTVSAASTNMKSPISDTETTPRTEPSDENKDYFKSAIRDTATTKTSRRNHWTVPTKRPAIDKDDFEDPISDNFWKERWVASAAHNTEIYRKVFHAIPDDLISTWKQYKEFILHHERLNKPVRETFNGEPVARIPSESADLPENPDNQSGGNGGTITNDMESERSKDECEDAPTTPGHASSFAANPEEPSKPRRPARGSEPFEKWEREQMEELLGKLNGHLVLYPNRFLEGEDIANNFLFNADRMLPLPIYN